MNKKNRGFSLIELIVVIAIMGLLISVLAPVYTRYIAKSQKAMDVETAKSIYDTVTLALNDSDAYEGWLENDRLSAGRATVKDPDGKSYEIRPVAWCRGVQYKNYENSYFKVAHDNSKLQKAFVNELLFYLSQEDAMTGKGYHGNTDYMLNFNYNKDSGNGVPECWIIYRRMDNNKAEIWIGRKKGAVAPKYRLYPNTCDEYS